ncbi:hypothetical protein [Campylobacter lanienae]|uniref:hypothetical protein n=2 Tax=Campylobacter lanienae TaxID=75658 RepID=UPI000BB43B9B|nr:hypothetical protein [Campylobacter lanienae]MDD6879097.1 hypothetical protein [bacterium]
MNLNTMRNTELVEKLKNRFKELEAYVEQELGAEKIEALSKIIYFNDKNDIEDIVYDDRYHFYCYDSDFKQFSKHDFVNAYLTLFVGNERDEKNEILAEYTDINEINNALEYIYENEPELVKDLSQDMAQKYFRYFYLDFIKEFLEE